MIFARYIDKDHPEKIYIYELSDDLKRERFIGYPQNPNKYKGSVGIWYSQTTYDETCINSYNMDILTEAEVILEML
ncbi:MAG: hypothetical protein GY861_29305 [bacterium]|nr:hypothetical protein [bacterium]